MASLGTINVDFDPSKCDALIEVLKNLDERITILEAKINDGEETGKD
jgi:hypothetical protein